MHIRPFRPKDGPAAARLFRETILAVNRRDYNEAACRAWAAGAEDEAAWTASFAGHPAFIAEEDGALLGFGDVRPDGYVDRLFVHAARQGEGIGTALLAALVRAAGTRRLRTEASLTARPFFLARGWQIVRRQTVARRGVRLENLVMETERSTV